MPYYDYEGFEERYFQGHRFSDGGNPAGYTRYDSSTLPYDHYAQKMLQDAKDRGNSIKNKPVLIVGCANGYTVDWLIQNGVDAYGMDISSWAISQAPDSISDRLYQGDATVEKDVKSVTQSIKPKGNKFELIVTEAVLSCLTDSEAQSLCNAVEGYTKYTLHRVWANRKTETKGGGGNWDTYYNNKTLSGWKTLCDPNSDYIWKDEREFQP